MAIWQKEIMKLANDFCLNVVKAKQKGKNEEEYKYDRAYSYIKEMIFAM